MLKLIRVDALRRVHYVGFLAERLKYRFSYANTVILNLLYYHAVYICLVSGMVSLAESLQPDDLQDNYDKQTITEPNSFIIQHGKELPTGHQSSNIHSEIKEPLGIPKDIVRDSANVLTRTDAYNESLYPDNAEHVSTEPLCERASVDHDSPRQSSVCHSCGLAFSSDDQYREHFTVSQCRIVCPTCGTLLPDLNSLTVHGRLDMETIPNHFDTEFVDILHILNDVSDTDVDCLCKSCCLSFDKKENFVHHTI